MIKKRLIVIGGGAAGFFCAVNAARLNPALEVCLLEKSNKLLSKVRISGGGRCNVTNACFSIAQMVKQYPRGSAFLKKAFHHFFTTDTIAWFNERGVLLKTEADGRIFPVSDSSETIISCLLKEARLYGVEIMMNKEVVSLSKLDPLPDGLGGKWSVGLQDGTILLSDLICVASGGYPKAIQFDWVTTPGHHIELPVPSLFTFNMPGNPITSLMGITVDRAVIKIAGSRLIEEGPLLITHWGMSGPVILKLSSRGARWFAECNWQFRILVNWVPGYHENSLREKFQQLRFDLASQKMYNRNPFGLPARLWEYLLVLSGLKESIRWADLTSREQFLIIKNLCVQEFEVKGKTTFKEEFVTAGGILLDEIDHNTMQSKKIPGLFFAGEVINADGVTGGYNFQNAWTTGWIASKGVGEQLKAEI